MSAILIPANIYAIIRDTQNAEKIAKDKLMSKGILVYYAVGEWRSNIDELLSIIATVPSVRKMDSTDAQAIFDRVSKVYPSRAWRLWSRTGTLLASTGVRLKDKTIDITSRQYFQQALQGKTSFDIRGECLSGSSCYIEAVPVYQTLSHPSSQKAAGVLTNVINLADTSKDFGLEGEAKRQEVANSNDFSNGVTPARRTTLSLQNNIRRGTEVLMVSRQGHVLFPLSTVNDQVSVQTPAQIAAGPWGRIVAAGQKAGPSGTFEEVHAAGKAFFTYSREIDPTWSIVAVSDKATIEETVLTNAIRAILRQVAILALISIVILFACRRSIKQIQVAASAVRQLSRGNFEARISSDLEDEIGQLYDDINKTGMSLQNMLQEKLAHALTDAQLQTAADIQKEFILQSLPSTDQVELAAEFDPAYEIGADWYDAISKGEMTYIVIADVCDKGIASALFMSVFRSLLHYSLLDETSESATQDPEQAITRVIRQVNNYMAHNHGQSAMFATLFLGAYRLSDASLTYISAGHEQAFAIHQDGRLEALQATGPAIGLFADTTHKIGRTHIQPGEILFTYTDGLVDARDPAGEPYGIQRLRELLSGLSTVETSAADLLNQASKAVNQHRQDAEQFDDTTILVMKVKTTSLG